MILPLSRTFLAESVYQAILDSLLSGKLSSGTEVSEAGLAAELHVSRTPVREALRRLTEEGLIQQDANRAYRVARFTARDLEEIYEMRLLLESAAAERAAETLGADELARLRKEADLLQKEIRKPDWTARALEFDLQFHDAIAAAARNDRLRREISRYRLLVRAFCRRTGTRESLEEAFREHLEVLKALERHDGPGAAAAMARHIETRLRLVLKHLGAP